MTIAEDYSQEEIKPCFAPQLYGLNCYLIIRTKLIGGQISNLGIFYKRKK